MKNLIKEIPVLKYFLILNIINAMLMMFSASDNSDADILATKADTTFSDQSQVPGKKTVFSGFERTGRHLIDLRQLTNAY